MTGPQPFCGISRCESFGVVSKWVCAEHERRWRLYPGNNYVNVAHVLSFSNPNYHNLGRPKQSPYINMPDSADESKERFYLMLPGTHQSRIYRCARVWHISQRLAGTMGTSQQFLNSFNWEVFPHLLPHNPDLVPSDFHLFPKMKTENGEKIHITEWQRSRTCHTSRFGRDSTGFASLSRYPARLPACPGHRGPEINRPITETSYFSREITEKRESIPTEEESKQTAAISPYSVASFT
ncbi:hypothetical protein J6590_051941 [Homalodisca vitripennis]|nr:hypothetical protein J6590_051941 [Homalodisca vitripennis]